MLKRISNEEIDKVVEQHRKDCIPCDGSFVEVGAQAQMEADQKELDAIGKPPLLSDEEIEYFIQNLWLSEGKAIAQAQRASDIRWLKVSYELPK